MDNKAIIALIIVVVCCAIGGLIYAGSVGTQSDNNDTVNNTTNTTNETNESEVVVQDIVSNQEPQDNQYSSESSSQESYQDSDSDWAYEGDTWYSKKLDSGNYALYDKSSGQMIGTGDMPDRIGYH